MWRIIKIFLSLLAIVAIVALGFAIFGAVNPVAAQASLAAILGRPAASASTGLAVASASDNGTVVVGPQQAGLCALHKLPAGTTIDQVNGAYSATTYDYYQVKLHSGNYTYTRYISAYNCAIIPEPGSDCALYGTNCTNNPELAEIVVSQQLAGLCALHKLPYGTVVDKVSVAIEKIPKPYYKVNLHFGNYAYTRYIDATNCNIIPNPN